MALQPTPTQPPAIQQPSPTATGSISAARPTPGPFNPAAFNPELELIADGLAAPVYVTHAGDGSGRLFVVEKAGTIRIIAEGSVEPTPFLDISRIVGSRASEQGLLSVAFHPSYASNGFFFVNYTDVNGDTVVARYSVSPDPNAADPNSARVILTLDQPAANHNGGMLAFGPDGYLYIGTGDGGRAGDPWDNAQNSQALLGKMLRLDVDGAEPYAIPPDNPFIGDSAARDEIWALGLRNPWRYSFDRTTGDLYMADVGQNAWEEIDFQPANSPGGENYGWNIMEGTHCFSPRTDCDQSGLTLPIAEYSHQLGCSVTGGYVYRGTAFPELTGAYTFGDFCSGIIWALYRNQNGNWTSAELLRSGFSISSFGEDETGELYLTNLRPGELYRLAARAR
jgi:glucose/arabinose dehydrogenase